MGVIALLTCLIAIAYLFIKAARFYMSFHKKIKDEHSGISIAMQKKSPRSHAYLKTFLPIVILGFWFNAACAIIGFIYVLVRSFQ